MLLQLLVIINIVFFVLGMYVIIMHYTKKDYPYKKVIDSILNKIPFESEHKLLFLIIILYSVLYLITHFVWTMVGQQKAKEMIDNSTEQMQQIQQMNEQQMKQLEQLKKIQNQ